jgi:sterol desaturase/sphingolipid hydroxylase (fatty acid hydroxylase superfamily)
MIASAIQDFTTQLHDTRLGDYPWAEWFVGSMIDFLTGPLTGLRTRSYWPELAAALCIAAIVFIVRDRRPGERVGAFLRYCFPRRMFLHQSTWVDCQLIIANHFISPLINITWRLNTVWMTGGLLAGMVWAFGPAPHAYAWTAPMIVVFTIVYALAEDFGYYVFHLLSHRVPWMWAFHKVHHSAETLQVFANVRVHPVEVVMTGPFKAAAASLVMAPAVYFGPGDAPFATILGINLMVAFYGLVGAQLHHCHIWLSWGPVLEHVFISPAQHQIHHSAAPRHWNRNMGGNFALWDWMFGTLYVPKSREALAFGLGGDSGQPHPTLLAAYLEPFWSILPLRVRLLPIAGRIFPWAPVVGDPGHMKPAGSSPD